MIIDLCVRPPYKSIGELNVFARVQEFSANLDPDDWPGFMTDMVVPSSILEVSMDLFMEEMDTAGLDMAVIHGRVAAPEFGCTSNGDIAELLDLYPGRFVALAGIDPTDTKNALAELEDIKKIEGFQGITIDPGLLANPVHADDAQLFPVYERCSELDLTVSVVSSLAGGPDLEYANPVHIQHVANQFPDLRILIKHGSYPWIMQALTLPLMCRNVWVCPDFYHFVRGMPGAQLWVEGANGAVEDRFVYASSYPARGLGQSVEEFRSFSFTDRALGAALGDNIVELLGMKHK